LTLKIWLNERQIKAVIYVKENRKITNKDYKELIKNISRITATRDLTNLVEKGILNMVGIGKRQVHYILNNSGKKNLRLAIKEMALVSSRKVIGKRQHPILRTFCTNVPYDTTIILRRPARSDEDISAGQRPGSDQVATRQ